MSGEQEYLGVFFTSRMSELSIHRRSEDGIHHWEPRTRVSRCDGMSIGGLDL